MKNPFIRLVTKVTQFFGIKWKVKSQEPLERAKEKKRSSGGDGLPITADSVINEKAKKENAYFYSLKKWKKNKKARKVAYLSRKINRQKRKNGLAA